MKGKIFVGKMSRHGDLTAPRNCHAYLTFELKEADGKTTFSACAELWNHLQTDIVMGGQCLTAIMKHFRAKDTPARRLYKIWQRYHLNDMRAGTPEQEAAVETWQAEGNQYSYERACDHLRTLGLLTVPHDGKPYTYGSGWLYEAIPDDVIEQIKELTQ